MLVEDEGVLARPGRPLRWAAVGILLFAWIGLLLAWFSHEAQVDQVYEETASQAQVQADAVDRFTEDAWSTLGAIAASPPMRRGDLAGMREYLHGLDAAAVGFPAGIGWVDEAGWQQVRSAPDTQGAIDFRSRTHVQIGLRERRPVVSSGIMGRVNRSPVVAFGVPVTTADGRPGGLVVGGLRLDREGAEAGRSLGEPPSVLVVDRLGQVLAGRGPVRTLDTVADGFDLVRLRDAATGSATMQLGPLGDPDRLVGWATAKRTGWTVLVDTPRATAFDVADRALAGRALAIGIAALLAAALLFWVAARLDHAVREQGRAYAEERATRGKLQAAVARLEQRAALRDAFVGVISHELRTPVTTIFGAAQLLAKSPRRPELETLVDDIEEEAARLQRITEDLLVLIRAEHDALDVAVEPILVQRLVPGIIADLRARHPDAEIRLEMENGMPPIHGDAAAISQVVTNLVSNAIKYGAASPVIVRAEAQAGTIALHVEDGGPGLPAEDVDRIFELFYRSPQNAGRAAGTGIGLFVVRELVRAMGGTIHAYAVDPKGLGFAFTLPMGDPGFPECAADTEPGAHPTKPVVLAGDPA